MLRYRTRPAPNAAEDAPVEVRPRDVLPTPAVGHVPGAGVVTATLPNGRTTWFRLDPAPVPVDQMNRIARQAARADVRHALHTRATGRSIEKLTRSLAKGVASVNAAQLRGDRALGAKLRKGDAKIEKKITKAAGEVAAAGTKSGKQLTRVVGRIRRRAIWDSAVIASAAPLFAAYGQRDNPFGSHNVTLAAALGVWLFGDELTDMISGRPDDPPTLVRDVDLWSYIAPFGNLLAGWWLMRDEQHHRFVTGTATTFEVSVRLPSTGTLTAELVRDVIIVTNARREETAKRLIEFAASLSAGDVARLGEAQALTAAALRALPDDARRALFRLYVTFFLVGGPTAEEIDPAEESLLVAIATLLGLDAAVLPREPLSDPELLATLELVARTVRERVPLPARHTIFAISSAVFDASAPRDAAVRTYLQWLAAALGLSAIEIVHTYAIDLASERIASGYEGKFRELAIAATAAIAEGTLSDKLECDTPRVTAAVDVGVLAVQVIVPVYGRRQRPLLALPVPPTEGEPQPAPATPPQPSEPASAEAPWRPASTHLAALREGRMPVDRDERETARRDLTDFMLEFLWTTPPKVAWIVDTQSPK